MMSLLMPAILMSICSAGDALGGAGHLEVHITEMVFIAENVGQDRHAVRILDQAHGDAGDRPRDRHAGIHHRQRAQPHTVAMEDEPLDSVISETRRIV
jgi:hypothetical protein